MQARRLRLYPCLLLWLFRFLPLNYNILYVTQYDSGDSF